MEVKRKLTLIELIGLQTANGFWPASALPSLQSFFGLTLTSNLPVDILCTIAALFVLEEFFAEKESEWTMIQQKAKAYLTQ